MKLNKPILIFDGDCSFCRVWIARWKRFTKDKVDYAPAQEIGKQFPEIPAEAFQKAVQLVEPNGHRTSAAEAVFRALRYGGSGHLATAYERLPGFAPVTEFAYSIVAGHRPIFSTFTRWLWGNPAVPSSYRQTRWIFLRFLAIIYGIAFASFGVQIKGLIGSEGILSAQELLRHVSQFGARGYWFVPSLAWVNSSDGFLVGLAVAGVVFSFLLFLNIASRFSLLCLWVLYLSLVSVGGSFMSFQWDALLLEVGFLAIFFAPRGLLPQRNGATSPGPFSLFLLRWVLFRLMIQSALVKWLSGDTLWRNLTALTVHYETQPLPNDISWFVHHLPVEAHKFCCAGMFVIEGLVPFLIFAPRKLRHFAFWPLLSLQLIILLTGNYTYFNLLAIALCFLLIEDSSWRSWLPGGCDEPLYSPSSARRLADPASYKATRPPLTIRGGDVKWISVVAVLFLTTIPFGRAVGIRWPRWVAAPVEWLSPLRSFNSYGLFAVMTPNRPEILVEGSNDGQHWLPYEFKYKPGDLLRRPKQVAPHQPRLDWQMWFAALGDYRQNQWFLGFCVRILQGSKPVLALLSKNPFPDKPPVMLRATLYHYRFSTPEVRKKTGQWWVRELKGPYCPVLSLKGRS